MTAKANEIKIESGRREREVGPDILRVLATLLVMTTHSIAYLGAMNTDVRSPMWTLCLIVRFTALTCVPLFLLLTGYLNRKKNISHGYLAYLRGLLPIIISYLLISAAGEVVTNYAGHTAFTPWEGFTALLNFTANGYAWYVEMYIGLYLMLPFLNMLFERMETLRTRLTFTVLLWALTMLPPAVESFRVFGVSLDVLPDYWEIMYPLAYYFAGALIGEYRPKLKKRYSIPLMLCAIALPCGLCYAFSSVEDGYAWYMMNGFGCLTTGLMALAIFIVLYDLTLPRIAKRVFAELSTCSFEMYLLSYVCDLAIYSKLSLPMPIMILTVFVLTYVAARLMRLVVAPIYRRMKG